MCRRVWNVRWRLRDSRPNRGACGREGSRRGAGATAARVISGPGIYGLSWASVQEVTSVELRVEHGDRLSECRDFDHLLPVRWTRVSESVDPDSLKARGECSVDVTSQAVAEHHRLLVRLCKTGQRVAEDRGIGLSGAEFT